MPKQNKGRVKRVKNLIVICTLSAVLLSISTYAWFIGMRSVHVEAFEVEIAGVESLLLSLDGETFGESVSINSGNFDDTTVVYDGHSNSWEPLIPMSTIGEIDDGVSRLKLYEKSSMTSTPGGYRIMSSRVNNIAEQPEQEGYVTFDLFIKNITGSEYPEALDILGEEAIYLTVDSEATVLAGGVQDTGIENSVRVAFAQIGRVNGALDLTDPLEVAKVTGITCTDDEANGVVGVCASRVAQIWEPNDTSHVENAIKWYNKSCRERTGLELTETDAYTENACGTVVDGLAYPTYAVNQAISSENKVDIYDGPVYNSYEDTIVSTENTDKFLTPYPYFTDTQKYLAGTARQEFMTLAPASITKVRVYIYLEGQDIDNYDFAQIGKQITINFGFTKQRFTEGDIDYNGPDVNQQLGPNGADLTPPRIVLAESRVEVEHDPLGTTYDDVLPTATDNKDESVTVTAHGTVNTAVSGTYYITYKAKDLAGNLGTAVKTVIVKPAA